MLTSTNPVDGALSITADVPKDTSTPPAGYFQEIKVLNWHGIRATDSRVMSDATIPAMVEHTLADGAKLLVWPDGTFVMYPDGYGGESYSQKITRSGVVPNPYRA